jgi:uncharacterized protein (TIGR02452 family)
MKVYEEHHVFNPVQRDQYQTKITVEDIDTLGAAQQYADPCCLNFASHKRPGGGYKSVQHIPMPIKTQEEDLFRRSNLPEMMDNKHVRQHYPLNTTKGLYCNNVQVDRDQMLVQHDPYFLSLITVAALVNPGLEHPMTERKVRRILEIAADNNEKTLILGAWGCGAFRNDPDEIAGLFKKYLENEFRGVFETVVFAIPGKQSRNFQVFESVLKG